MFTEIKEAAHELHLDVIAITYGTNGYPQRLGNIGVIAFDSFEDAQAFALKYNGEVCEFHKRDGWQFYEYRGGVFEAYSVDDYLRLYGENYMIADVDAQQIKERLTELANGFTGSFNDLEEYISNTKEIQEAISYCKSSKTVIVNCGRLYDEIDNSTMKIYHDTHYYVIGVIFRVNDFINE